LLNSSHPSVPGAPWWPAAERITGADLMLSCMVWSSDRIGIDSVARKTEAG
jgi:hypothetical protein